MMKQIRFKWKYVLASIALANLIACSNDGIPQVDMRQEQVGGSRTTELVTQAIELQSAGTLQAKVEEAMGDSAVTTLQKLVLSGPFTSTDMTYLRDSLTGLSVLDMKDVQIKASDVPYHSGNTTYFQDNYLCDGMFRELPLKELALPVSVSAMGNQVFYNCDSLRAVILPDSLEMIGREAFYHCDSLASIIIPNKVNSIGYGAFMACYSLASVTMPAELKTLDAWSFAYCSFTSIVLPDGLVGIGDHAFYICQKLETIVIPKSVGVIYSAAFQDCYSLSSVVIEPGLKEIYDWSFANCSFSSIDLPVGLEKIGYYAFYCCRNLKKMIVPETITTVGDYFVSYSGLQSLIWNPAIDVPSCHGVGNCFLFVNTDRIGVNSVNEWKSIVINGYAETTINVDGGDSNGEFANLTEFTAKKLTYTKNFSDWPQTTPGGSSGWQTIVLPFTPDSIYHETKGQIAPFNSGIEGAKPFWLRELTSEGFVDVTKIEANKPYIIAMPNHDSYLEEYRLYGNITFVAKNQVLTVTPAELEPSVGPEFELHPTYKYVGRSDGVYALDHQHGYYEEEDMYYYKSFFFKNRFDVRKFNAYATPLGGGRSSRSSFGLDTRSKETRASYLPNKTGIPQIGDM